MTDIEPNVSEASKSAPAADRQPTAPHRRRPDLGNFAQRFGLPLAWLAVIVFFSLKLPDIFFTQENMATILGSQAVLVVVTLGLLIPLTAGDYDLSIASTLALSANTVALVNVNHHRSIWVAMLAAVLVAMLVGLVNGGFVVLFGVDPFIVTLGMATFLQGIVFWISASQNITGVDQTLIDWTIIKRFLNVPIEFYYGLAVCVVIWFLFEFTRLGRRLLFVGRGRNVALLSGIKVGRLRWGALVASATIAGLAGILYAGTLGSSDPTSGTTFLLPAYAAAFLGATAITPGRFNAWGTIIAVYFLVTGINGLQLLGVPSYVQQLFYGGALVLAVALSQVSRHRADEGQGRIPTWVLAVALGAILASFVALLVYLGLTQTG